MENIILVKYISSISEKDIEEMQKSNKKYELYKNCIILCNPDKNDIKYGIKYGKK